jgi:hypothetical protein
MFKNYFSPPGPAGADGVNFDGTNEYRATIPTLPAQHTVACLCNMPHGLGGSGLLTADGSVSGPVGFIMNQQPDDTMAFWGFTAADAPGNVATPADPTIAGIYTLKRTGTAIIGCDSDQNQAAIVLAAGSTRSNVLLQVGPDPGLPSFSSAIGLILIYDHVLTPTELTDLYTHLNQQFGTPF